MGGMHFGPGQYRNMLLWLTLLLIVQAVSSQTQLRPIFVVGNMANTKADVDSFLQDGANALEADVRFSDDGTAVRVYHGFPCDCFRNCEGETSFGDYLEYIKSITSVAGAKYQNKVRLLGLSLKTQDVSRDKFYQAGVDVVNELVQHLWKDVPVADAVNVLLYVGGVTYEDVFKGAVQAIGAQSATGNWTERIGYDFGPFVSLDNVGDAFADLNITGHRWQGDGTTNCIANVVGSLLIPGIVSCRDGYSRTCNYVDKAYVWNLDSSGTIKRMILAGSDAIVTNAPATVLQVLNQRDVASKVRIAGPQDSPWTRVVIKS